MSNRVPSVDHRRVLRWLLRHGIEPAWDDTTETWRAECPDCWSRSLACAANALAAARGAGAEIEAEGPRLGVTAQMPDELWGRLVMHRDLILAIVRGEQT